MYNIIENKVKYLGLIYKILNISEKGYFKLFNGVDVDGFIDAQNNITTLIFAFAEMISLLEYFVEKDCYGWAAKIIGAKFFKSSVCTFPFLNIIKIIIILADDKKKKNKLLNKKIVTILLILMIQILAPPIKNKYFKYGSEYSEYKND